MSDHNEAMRLAEWIEDDMSCQGDAEVAAMLRQQAERIAELEGELRQMTNNAGDLAVHLQEVTAERDQLRADVEMLRADAERLDWLLWRIPNAIRHCVGELADTSDGDKFRAAIDNARTTHKDE